MSAPEEFIRNVNSFSGAIQLHEHHDEAERAAQQDGARRHLAVVDRR